MGIYARPGWRMMGQVVGDLCLVGWVVLWGLVGRGLQHAVAGLASPARASARTAQSMADQMDQAREKVSGVPMAGQELAQPFDSLSGGLHSLVEQANHQAASIVTLSYWAGALCFVVPNLLAILWWVPRRIRFHRQAAATRRLIDADEDLQLFALRAMANVPMPELARITDDPVGQWRAGNGDVIRRLAELEFHRLGLEAPRRRS